MIDGISKNDFTQLINDTKCIDIDKLLNKLSKSADDFSNEKFQLLNELKPGKNIIDLYKDIDNLKKPINNDELKKTVNKYVFNLNKLIPFASNSVTMTYARIQLNNKILVTCIFIPNKQITIHYKWQKRWLELAKKFKPNSTDK